MPDKVVIMARQFNTEYKTKEGLLVNAALVDQVGPSAYYRHVCWRILTYATKEGLLVIAALVDQVHEPCIRASRHVC